MNSNTVGGRVIVTSPGYVQAQAADGTPQAISLDDLARSLHATAQITSPSPPANLPSIASGDVLGNSTAGSAQATDTTLTALLDRAFGSAQGNVLYRDASAWKVLAPGTSGQFLKTLGASANPAWATVSGGGGAGLFNQVMSATPTAASTLLANWFHQGSATVGDGAVGVWIDLPAGAGQNVTGRYITTAPAAPYSYTALVTITSGGGDGTNNIGVGIGWLDSGTNTHSIQLIQVGTGAPLIQVQKRASGTASASTDFSLQRYTFAAPIWLKITDDGTNAIFAYSMDGVKFLTAFSVAKASGFLGGSGYLHPIFMVGGEANNDSTDKIGTLLSWTQS